MVADEPPEVLYMTHDEWMSLHPDWRPVFGGKKHVVMKDNAGSTVFVPVEIIKAREEMYRWQGCQRISQPTELTARFSL